MCRLYDHLSIERLTALESIRERMMEKVLLDEKCLRETTAKCRTDEHAEGERRAVSGKRWQWQTEIREEKRELDEGTESDNNMLESLRSSAAW